MELLADILFSYEVTVNLFISSLLFALLSIAFFKSLFIVKNYNINASTSLQYSLEKSSYLVITIIYLSLIIKLLLLPFFTYILNSLADLIPGAMCGAGVISANSYGEPLMVLKIFIVILTMLWLTLNAEDLRSKNFVYFKSKMIFFWLIYLLSISETLLEILFFINLSTVNPVSCCSTLYVNAQGSNPLPFNISTIELVISFYTLSIFIITAAYFRQKYILALLAIVYTYISHLSIVYYFSTYVYQLPTHKCPYCLLQSDYYYIGYFIYASLIIATFYALSSALFSFDTKALRKSIIFYTLFLFLVSINFILYLIINRTFL